MTSRCCVESDDEGRRDRYHHSRELEREVLSVPFQMEIPGVPLVRVKAMTGRGVTFNQLRRRKPSEAEETDVWFWGSRDMSGQTTERDRVQQMYSR